MTAIWTIRARQKLAKLLARLRHPLNGAKRKLFRGRLIETIEFNGFLKNGRLASKTTDGASFSSPSPTLSVIIPNYNHARFLSERVRSILAQGVAISELIILDDASTDDSRNVIRELAKNISVPVRLEFNEVNSGRIFRQWEKGIELAKGDLIWLCESDDTCGAGFLSALVPYFEDPSVMMAFGRIDSIDGNGTIAPQSGVPLTASKFWQQPIIASARSWFNGPFGNKNIIANVGGCLFRRQKLSQDIIDEFTSYRICGDWFLYSRLARGGRIAYDPAARAYFRVHTSNTSKASLKSEDFYEEHVGIARALRRHYGVDASTIRLLLQNVWAICAANRGRAAARQFADRISVGEVLQTQRTVRHVLLDARAGDETIVSAACQLADALSNRGDDVSILLASDSAQVDRVRGLLSPAVSVLSSGFVEAIGALTFLEQFGITAVCAAEDNISGLHDACRALGVPIIKCEFEQAADENMRGAIRRQMSLVDQTSSISSEK